MLAGRGLLATLAFAVAGCWAADQDFLTILKQQNGVSTFTSLIDQFPDLVDTLNRGVFSVLVPNDQALATFGSNNPDLTSNADAVRALVQYHLANGTQPSASFGLQPLFVPTLLTSSNYTNVTGGQVVELASMDGRPTVVTGVKATSHVVEADIFFQGGLIHILDSVLTIPISFPATITKANLTDLVALLTNAGFVSPSSPAVSIVNSLDDLTVFGANDPRFGASFTGWDNLTETQLLANLQYSISQGPVLYSSKFKNNTKIPTLDGISSTMTELNDQFYVDTSLITTTDYLTSNGVLHVIDRPLDPNTSGQRPSSTPIASSGGGSGGGLSTAAAAGIGIAIAAIVLGGALVVALYIRTKRRRRFTELAGGPARDVTARDVPRGGGRSGRRSEIHPTDPPPTYELDTKSIQGGDVEQNAPRTHVFEIHHPPKPPSPQEIDGEERSRISVTIQGATPRHLGFQARY